MDTEARYLKLDPANPDFRRAVGRTIKGRVQAHVVSETKRIFTVRSSTDLAQHYVIRLAVPIDGLWIGFCNCPGGQRGYYCQHLTASAALSERLAKQRAATKQAEAAA